VTRVTITELGKAGVHRVRRLGHALRRHRGKTDFGGSADYWDRRYRVGSDSGAGSYGQSALRKAAFINGFVAEHNVGSVIEFGCGDGNQLSLAEYPRYLGFDVSPEAVRTCRLKFEDDPTKTFKLVADYDGDRADLTLSLDVIFHLVEDAVYEDYMRLLFQAADRYVIVYATNTDRSTPLDRAHVRHRRFTDWTATCSGWQLVEQPRRYTVRRRASFFVFERTQAATARR
jgi:SAM-dependent methyltransferase